MSSNPIRLGLISCAAAAILAACGVSGTDRQIESALNSTAQPYVVAITAREEPPPSEISPEGGMSKTYMDLSQLDPATGKPTRIIARGDVRGTELSSDHTVYWLEGAGCGAGEPARLLRTNLSRDEQAELVSERAIVMFTVSDNGSKLALLESRGTVPIGNGFESTCSSHSDLVVIDTRTGSERRWDATVPDLIIEEAGFRSVYNQGVRSLAWAPDGRHLAFRVRQHIHILDTEETSSSVLDAPPVPAGDDTHDHSVVYFGDTGRLLVGRGCCGPTWTGDPPGSLVLVEPATGATEAFVFDTEGYASSPRPLATDRTGEHVILAHSGGAGDPLYLWQDGRELRLGNAVYDADLSW